ncbi:hypothetical protein RD792_007103 [Penstemon davidsonii]|uniref:Pentatricopeptide repeat-containing protein n=1 Tax=Penstemon davidsonii TaxID=160366 RepID=A0ABR0D5I8_9LAMI|nr:hypothetical protein RD792_007103 [Penstemon davidsonii]
MSLGKVNSGRHRPPNPRTLASLVEHSSYTKCEFITSPPQKIPSPVQPKNTAGLETISITNTTHWTKCIHNLCTTHCDADATLHLLHDLRVRGFHPNSLNISSIIHALCHANRYSEAHHRFLLFISSHCSPDEHTCNLLIARLLNGRDPYSTLRVINALADEKPEFVPSLVNFNRLIDGFCKLGRLEVAHLLFYHMIERGHRPNVVSFTTLISGYSMIGKVCAAEKVFDEMSECGVRCNALTYTALIRGVLRKRELENGIRLMGKVWEVMEYEDDVQVNNAAFCSVVDCLCREGLFHEVFKIVEDMPQGKNVPEGFAYGQMIDSLCKFERYNAAARIVYMMRKRGFTPSLVSYNLIVHGLCNDDDCLRAYQLWEEGMEFGYLPSEFTSKVRVEGLCRD